VAEERVTRVAVIVLAAGGSTRMGEPKQLLRFDGESLVRRAAKTALASRCAAVFVVVGAHAAAVAHELDGLALTLVENARWQEGMGSSIRAGVEAVTAAEASFDAVLVMLADQPAVTATLLNRLIAASATASAGLVGCEYAGTIGAPALFARRHFEALRGLTGDHGGKVVLAAHADAVVRIAFPRGAVDVDTRDDYDRALSALQR
jgi:molybdenum cofactor cytidylyltransferase